MKFLIIGCNGMAGHVISIYMKEQGHIVVGYAREKSRFVHTIIGDAADFKLLKKTIWGGSYDAVINCVGILNQFAEKQHAKAVLFNGYLPHYLADITEGTTIQIIHMSTDCVFSGKKGKYTEQAIPDGRLFYDRTKAMGELDDNKNITFRNSIVGPDIKRNGIGLLNWFMQQNSEISGFTKAIWTGQTTLQLAKTMEVAAIKKAYGLYHAVPKESISKYELLTLCNKYIRKKRIEIVPSDKWIADKSLVRTRYDGFEYEIPGYEVMIKELGEWMREHKELYPYYEL